jgi:hypothetical protein
MPPGHQFPRQELPHLRLLHASTVCTLQAEGAAVPANTVPLVPLGLLSSRALPLHFLVFLPRMPIVSLLLHVRVTLQLTMLMYIAG